MKNLMPNWMLTQMPATTRAAYEAHVETTESLEEVAKTTHTDLCGSFFRLSRNYH